MKRQKEKKIFNIINLILYIACCLVLIVESSMNGSISRGQSDVVGGVIADTINGIVGDQNDIIAPTEAKVTNPINEILVGEFYTFSVETTPSNATYKSYIYESSNLEIATIDGNGKAYFKSPGSVTFNISNKVYEKVTTSITVNVKAIPLVAIKSVLMYNSKEVNKDDEGNYLIKTKENYFISTSFTPENATNKDLIFTSSNENYISFSSSSFVANKESKEPITITATSKENNKLSSSFSLIIKNDEIPLKEITTNTDSYTLSLYQKINLSSSKLLNFSFVPSNATNKEVIITTNNKDIVNVNGTNIEAKKEGEATINIQSKTNSNISKNISISVKKILVESYDFSIDASTKDIQIGIGEKKNVKLVNVKPTNATYLFDSKTKNNSLISSNSEVLTINKLTITGNKEGESSLSFKIDPSYAKENIVSVTKNIKILDYKSEVSSFQINNNFELTTDDNNQSFSLIEPGTEFDLSKKIKINKYLDKNGNELKLNSPHTIYKVDIADSSSYTFTNNILNITNVCEGNIIIIHQESGLSKTIPFVSISKINSINDNTSFNEIKIINGTSNDYLINNFDSLQVYKYEFTSPNDYLSFSSSYNSFTIVSSSNVEDEYIAKLKITPLLKEHYFSSLVKEIEIHVIQKDLESFVINVSSSSNAPFALKEIDSGYELQILCSDIYNFEIINQNETTRNQIIYEYGNSKFVKIENGKIIPLKAGKVTLTIYDKYNPKTKKIVKVIVANKIIFKENEPLYSISGEKVSYDKEKDVFHITNGYSANIKFNFDPSSTFTIVNYKVDNEKVIQIGKDGVFLPLNVGEASITCTINDSISINKSYTIKMAIDQKNFIEEMSSFFYMIRKGIGHFSAFLVLGIFSTLFFMLFFDKKYWGYLIPINLLQGLSIASLTELIQVFVQGRSGLMSDVWIDYSGFIVSALVITLVILIITIVRNHKRKVKKID